MLRTQIQIEENQIKWLRDRAKERGVWPGSAAVILLRATADYPGPVVELRSRAETALGSG